MSMDSHGDWRPSGCFEWLRLRAALQADIRAFFAARDVTEVNTPLITRSGVTEPQIQSVALAAGPAYLRTSPEYHHKRLLAAGFGDLYELGPVMRAAEHGRLHSTEFTLLEWYRLGWDWRALAAESVELIQHCTRRSGQCWATRSISWRELFIEYAGLDPFEVDEQTLQARSSELPEDCDRLMRLDYLLSTSIQPHLPAGQLTVVHHFPAAQAALAEVEPEDQRVARRFEIFAGPIELGNGYQELRDPLEQRRRFEADNQRRLALGLASMPIDECLLAALAHGLPPCSGMALGLDRLLLVMTGADSLSEILAFS